MDFLVLIQARCGSSRLPNKVLMDLGGQSGILRVVERVNRSKHIKDVIVVTSIDINNLPLIKICVENNIRVFIGSEQDVLDRYYQCARLLSPKYVIRITADCPVFDWRYLDMAVELVKKDFETDYLADINETFPDGLDLEIIKFSALYNAWKYAKLLSEREHVTMYIKNNSFKFNITNFSCPIKNISNYRWTLDEIEDYRLLKKIYEHFISINKEDFITEDILDYLNENPELININSKYARNEGLKKSLKNDKQ